MCENIVQEVLQHFWRHCCWGKGTGKCISFISKYNYFIRLIKNHRIENKEATVHI